MQKIDWSSISDEQFQSLCVSLLYREGYRNIMPLGSRGVKEEGRDAIDETVIGENNNKITVFQFKRWTSEYSVSALKRMIIKELNEKIVPSGRKIDEYWLVTCHSFTKLKNWFSDELPQNYSFRIRYFEKTWLENRLNSDNQDLRREYFGVNIEKHSPESLIATCLKQTKLAIKSVGTKYIPKLYIERSIENEVENFLESEKACFVVVDRSGRGKTNLLCHLSEKYSSSIPVAFVFGLKQISSEKNLAVHIFKEYGYTDTSLGLDDVDRVCKEGKFKALILIDGISENNDVNGMKNALRELLLKYGDKKNLKFIFTCRDTLWPRFKVEFPDEFVYQTKTQVSLSSNSNSPHIGSFLGDWSDTELERAIEVYSDYFNVQFNLSRDTKRTFRYPLLLRLFCETYRDESVGFVDKLPLRKIFDSYLDTKIQRIADYFGINYSPERIRKALFKLREKMWQEDDRINLDQDVVDEILLGVGFTSPDALLVRMCDEGILIWNSSVDDSNIRFSFDEIGDYILFLVLRKEYLQDLSSDSECIDYACKLLKGEDVKKITFAEKYLILLARNLEDLKTLDHLLENVLNADIRVFSQCAWQRIAPSAFKEETDIEKAKMFGGRLVYFYSKIINLYFSNIKFFLDTFNAGNIELGVEIATSPLLREINYSYVNKSKNLEDVVVTPLDTFPTWWLSLTDANGKTIQMHDPEKGILVSIIRGFGDEQQTLRVLDFEWDSPFRGVSLNAPDKLGLYDVWIDIANALDNHQVLEPKGLMIERAYSLSRILPDELISVVDLEDFKIKARDIYNSLPDKTRKRADFRKNSDEFHYYMSVLGTNKFEESLPAPDLVSFTGNEKEQIWNLYSNDLFVAYLRRLFSNSVTAYKAMIDINFSNLTKYFNLYQQMPSTFFVLVNSSRTYIRLCVLPEEVQQKNKFIFSILSADADVDISASQLIVDDKPHKYLAETLLKNFGRANSSTTPIDIIIPMKELFINNPTNALTLNLIKAELAQLLSASFTWPIN